MKICQIYQKDYKIVILEENNILNIYVNKKNQKGKDKIAFMHSRLLYKESFDINISNIEFINKIKDNNIIIDLKEEYFDEKKSNIKFLNLEFERKINNDKGESKIIFTKKIYKFNVQYYLTKGTNYKRINYFPFSSCIETDFFNIEDILNLIDNENISNIYNIDDFRYFNAEKGRKYF